MKRIAIIILVLFCAAYAYPFQMHSRLDPRVDPEDTPTFAGLNLNGDLDTRLNNIIDPGTVDGSVQDISGLSFDNATIDAYWQFNDPTATTTIVDSANSNDLTLQAGSSQFLNRGSTTTWFGDGTAYYKAVGYTGIAQSVEGFAISVWIKPDAGIGQDRYITSWGDSGTGGANFQSNVNVKQLAGATDLNTFSIFFGNGNITLDVDLLTDGLWHHIAVCVPASANIRDISIYLDGDLQVIPDGDITNPGNPLAITATADVVVGANIAGAGPWFGGLDESAIFSNCLTDAEVADIYERQRTKFIGGSSGNDTDFTLEGNAQSDLGTAGRLVIGGSGTFGGDLVVGDFFEVTASNGNTLIAGALAHDGTTAGFFGTAPITKPINTVAIDTLLVNLGLRFSGGVANFDTVLTTTAGREKNTTLVTSSPYTVLAADEDIIFDTDSASITANLPAGVDGAAYTLKNAGTTGNDVVVVPNGAELLDGANASKSFSKGVVDLSYQPTKGWQ